MNAKEYRAILEETYNKANRELHKDNGTSFLNSLKTQQKEWILAVAETSESLKAVTTALTTSLVKKVEDPKQDVRYHKTELKNGYSGRTLDTSNITPFFKKKFRRIAMKESGWLTRSIEQAQPFTLDFRGKIRNKKTKNAFLNILNDVEERKADPEKYLVALFIFLIRNTAIDTHIIHHTTIRNGVPINSIVDCLATHFFHKYDGSGASRLPVIALYSIYQLLTRDVARFKGKRLLPIKSHIAPDVRGGGVGDIEVVDGNGAYFEAIEIKHGIPIDSVMIEDAYEKFKNTPIRRYYLLTTAEPNIKAGEEQEVKKVAARIRVEHGCEVIVNGLIPSLRYYLRLLREPNNLLENYTKNLELEFQKTTEVKKEHIEVWQIIMNSLM